MSTDMPDRECLGKYNKCTSKSYHSLCSVRMRTDPFAEPLASAIVVAACLRGRADGALPRLWNTPPLLWRIFAVPDDCSTTIASKNSDYE